MDCHRPTKVKALGSCAARTIWFGSNDLPGHRLKHVLVSWISWGDLGWIKRLVDEDFGDYWRIG